MVKVQNIPKSTNETFWNLQSIYKLLITSLTLNAPITTAIDNKFCAIFPNFRKKKGMILHENRLPADDSHEFFFF